MPSNPLQPNALLRALFFFVWFGCIAIRAESSLPPLDFSAVNEPPRYAARAWQLSAYVGEVKHSSPQGTVADPPFSNASVVETLRGGPLSGDQLIYWTAGITTVTQEDPACTFGSVEPLRPCKMCSTKPPSLEASHRLPRALDYCFSLTHATNKGNSAF